jgi:hypothetical protein
VVAGVYLTLRSIAPFADPAPQAARKLITCMAAMGLSWGSLGYVVLYWGTPESVIYAIGIISTVSSGALGLGAPLYRAYVTYLTCAIGGVMMAVALAGGPVMWPALFLTGVYYALTGMQARTAVSWPLPATTCASPCTRWACSSNRCSAARSTTTSSPCWGMPMPPRARRPRC